MEDTTDVFMAHVSSRGLRPKNRSVMSISRNENESLFSD